VEFIQSISFLLCRHQNAQGVDQRGGTPQLKIIIHQRNLQKAIDS